MIRFATFVAKFSRLKYDVVVDGGALLFNEYITLVEEEIRVLWLLAFEPVCGVVRMVFKIEIKYSCRAVVGPNWVLNLTNHTSK